MIKIDLDFSDKKSQNLFIYQQKYSMKKNDCYNLNKKNELLTHKNNDLESKCKKQEA